MKEKETALHLNDELLIGKGAHKAAYRHPHVNGMCIKIPCTEPDVDLERELRYRKIRDWRRQSSSLLPAYYGTVATNMGTGYIFERICDYDGANSAALNEYLEVPPHYAHVLCERNLLS